MATMNQASHDILESLAHEDVPVLETVAHMHMSTFERHGFDEQTALGIAIALDQETRSQ
jgi:hypothetical protein